MRLWAWLTEWLWEKWLTFCCWTEVDFTDNLIALWITEFLKLLGSNGKSCDAGGSKWSCFDWHFYGMSGRNFHINCENLF